MIIELKVYVPVIESNWTNSKWFTKLKEIKFHGNPPKIKLLIYSKIENEVVNIKIDKRFFFGLRSENTSVESPKNIPKNRGIKINASGISGLNWSSKVSELVIQYKLEMK